MRKKTRLQYDAEFKRNAISLVNNPGHTHHKVEKSSGINQGFISKRQQQLKKSGLLAFPGNGVEALTSKQKHICEIEKKHKDVEIDRGIQYGSEQFRNNLKPIHANQPMSREANCWDKAVTESFFHNLITRLTHHKKYNTIEK